MTNPELTAAFTAVINEHLELIEHEREGLPAPQILVQTPDIEYTHGDRNLPFHAASIGKLATAILTMQEVERGLDLSTKVSDLLPAKEIEGLFAAPGATVEQLLRHTSGAADFFEGPVIEGPTTAELIASEPSKFWTPTDMLNVSRERQALIGLPGEKYYYSDTGFVLLGRILEECNGLSFREMLRSRLFEPAGMKNSVLWLREPGPSEIAPAWLGEVEVSGLRSLSVDWSGGGIVTTLDDLALMLRSWSDGTLISRETWEQMTTPVHTFRPGLNYGLGTMCLDFGGFAEEIAHLPDAFGGVGVLSPQAFIDVKNDTVVVMNFHGTEEMIRGFQTHIQIAMTLDHLGQS